MEKMSPYGESGPGYWTSEFPNWVGQFGGRVEKQRRWMIKWLDFGSYAAPISTVALLLLNSIIKNGRVGDRLSYALAGAAVIKAAKQYNDDLGRLSAFNSFLGNGNKQNRKKNFI